MGILQVCNYSHTKNESSNSINLNLGIFISFITVVNKAILLICVSYISWCGFLYVLGLQDITSRFKQFSIQFGVMIWMGDEFYIMSTWEEVICTSWYFDHMGVCTLSWHLSHVGPQFKSIINHWYKKHLNL